VSGLLLQRRRSVALNGVRGSANNREPALDRALRTAPCWWMPTWMQCTSTDGNVIRINLDHVVTLRPYQRDRGGKGSEITFAGGSPSSLVVREDQDRIASSRQKSTTDRLEAEPRQKMRGGHAVSGRLCSRLCIAFMQSAQELGYRSVTHRTLARLRAQQPTVAIHPIKVLPGAS
jgi:hypothetical protein